MKKLIIADITSLKKDNKCFGHFSNVSNMYLKIFDSSFDVRIAGGPIYLVNNYKNIIELKFDNDIESMKNLIGRLRIKLREIINGITLVRNKNNDIIVFQSYSINSILISLLFVKGDKDIYLIQYRNQINRILTKILYKIVNKKISGIICPNIEVGKSYNKRYIVVPDYIYTGKSLQNEKVNKEYDFGMFGLMSEGKDVEDIVDTFKNTNYRVLIAGYFSDSKRYDDLINRKSKNIEIVNKYLDDDEYKMYIKNTKYVILPYKNYYKQATSGVVFDVLFNGTPVITKSYDTFSFVQDYGVGILYRNKLIEVNSSELLEDKFYIRLCENIHTFILDNKTKSDELIKFINKKV